MTNQNFGDKVRQGMGMGLGFALFGSWMLPVAGLALLFVGKRRPQQQAQRQEPKPAPPPVLDPKIARDALRQIELINSEVQAQKDRAALESAWKSSSSRKKP